MLFLALYALGDPRCQGAVDLLHLRRQMCLIYSARHTSDNTQECSRYRQFQFKFIQLSADASASPPCARQVHPRSMIGVNRGCQARRHCTSYALRDIGEAMAPLCIQTGCGASRKFDCTNPLSASPQRGPRRC